jgi:DNA-binding MarR family transcriptional regulator
METRSLGLLLHDATRAVRKRFEARSASYGLTSAQWRMMIRVCKTEGGARQSHFADLLEIEPISVSRLLDRMEATGWVTRAADPGDRRVRLVFPTDKAMAVFAEFKPIADEVYAEALQGFSAEQHSMLLDSLGTIISNLAMAADPVEAESGKKEPS